MKIKLTIKKLSSYLIQIILLTIDIIRLIKLFDILMIIKDWKVTAIKKKNKNKVIVMELITKNTVQKKCIPTFKWTSPRFWQS